MRVTLLEKCPLPSERHRTSPRIEDNGKCSFRGSDFISLLRSFYSVAHFFFSRPTLIFCAHMLYGLRIFVWIFPLSPILNIPIQIKHKQKKRISLIFAFLRIQQNQGARAFIALSPCLISNKTKTIKKKWHTKRKAHAKKKSRH